MEGIRFDIGHMPQTCRLVARTFVHAVTSNLANYQAVSLRDVSNAIITFINPIGDINRRTAVTAMHKEVPAGVCIEKIMLDVCIPDTCDEKEIALASRCVCKMRDSNSNSYGVPHDMTANYYDLPRTPGLFLAIKLISTQTFPTVALTYDNQDPKDPCANPSDTDFFKERNSRDYTHKKLMDSKGVGGRLELVFEEKESWISPLANAQAALKRRLSTGDNAQPPLHKKKFQARIYHDGKQQHLGFFAKREDAVRAYKEAKEMIAAGTFESHPRAANGKLLKF